MFAETLHESLDDLAAKAPETAAMFPADEESVSMADLASSSVSLAIALLDAGIRPGDRVGLLCPNEPFFLRALFALSRTGAAACPLPLPVTLNDLTGYVARISRVFAAAGVTHVVATGQYSQLVDGLAAALPHITVLRPDDLRHAGEERNRLPKVSSEATAIIQFTSGSTAAPKGVQLTHTNVIACIEAIVEGAEMGEPSDAGAIWLPLYHDMGLFGTLAGLLTGLRVTIWSPLTFVKNPARWLRSFQDSRAAICPCPNFAYDYLLDAISPEQAKDYDLSRWRIAFNGAETIAVASVEAFLERFAVSGFRPETMFPVYGLAEATLAVTFPPVGRAPLVDWVNTERLARDQIAVQVGRSEAQARGIVSVGRPVRAMRLRIADPVTSGLCDDARVGEVQLRGRSVTSGYLSDDADMVQPFTSDGWLKTGDLGYVRGGELFLTGRLKEMIVVRGANYYPEDVEAAVRGLTGVHKRRCVAFANGVEQMTLVAETLLSDPHSRSQLTADILAQVSSVAGLHQLDVRLVRPGAIPRTTSGKLQRLAMRDTVVSAQD